MNIRKLILSIVILINSGFSATFVVDLSGGGDYTSIYSAVDEAQSGDSLLIMSGLFIHPSSIEIDKELHIIGSGYDLPENGGTYILGSSQIFNFTSSSDGSSLQGLRLDGNGNPLINVNADDMLIENNYMRNSYNQGHLMILTSVSVDTIRNNIMVFNETVSYRPGISLDACTSPVICNNLFAYFSWWTGAIRFTNGTNSILANNIFLHCEFGTYFGGAGLIANNIYMNNTTGLFVDVGSNPSIFNNCFFSNNDNGTTGTDPILSSPDFLDYSASDIYTDESYDNDGYDFHLQGASPCVDAGYDPAEYNDLDGSQNDLGIYGWQWPMGTNGAPQMPIINEISVTPSGVAPDETISIEIIGRFGD